MVNSIMERNALSNAKWLVGCKIFRALLTLLIGMFTARYLGPSNYGLINYAASIVAFVVPVMQLGLRSTLVKEYVEKPEKEGAVMGTALIMNLISSLACMVNVVLFVLVANAGETETVIVCALYSLCIPFQALEMVEYWFQSKLMSKYSSVAMLFAYVVVSVYKIILLATQKSIYWFAVSHAIDYFVTGAILLFLYFKISKQKLTFSFKLAKGMFHRSKYYIISAMMVTIFANTDHVMLKMMIGDTENGYYTAAVTCANVMNFVYAALIDSARPGIFAAKEKNISEFENKMSTLYSIIIYLALLQSVGFTICAKPFVFVLYGEEYIATIPVLRIVVWYIAFSYIGTVRNIWILAEGKQNLLWIINLSGVIINIMINYILIPFMGAQGAALASVATQFFVNVIMGMILRPIRRTNQLMYTGLSPRFLIGVIAKITKNGLH